MPSKKSSTRITKTLVNEKFNINHPDIKEQVELAFESGGVKYFRFKDEFRMPAGRYKYVYAYLKETELRMTHQKLKEYVEELTKCLDGSKKVIDIEGAWKVVFALKGRVNLAFEPESVRRLASVCYFDSKEDLSTYEQDHNQKKIDSWIKNKCLDFFLTRPISELFGLTNISVTSLEEYLKEAEMIMKDLDSGHPRPSQGNS